MCISAQFQFWQVVAVKAILDFMKDDHIRGCILADVVGLGKTWVVVGYMLWVSVATTINGVAKDFPFQICCRSLSQRMIVMEVFCNLLIILILAAA